MSLCQAAERSINTVELWQFCRARPACTVSMQEMLSFQGIFCFSVGSFGGVRNDVARENTISKSGQKKV